MRTLVIDTATEKGVVAILDDEKIFFHEALPVGLQSSHSLIPLLEKVPLEGIERIVVGNGPGSYTGVRVGASVAKTLSYSLQVPLVGVSSLAGFAREKKGDFAVVVDAKISGVYVLEMDVAAVPRIIAKDEVEQALSSYSKLYTPHPEKLKKKFPSLEFEESDPNPRILFGLGNKTNHYSLDGELEILYLRKTQAEIEANLGRSD